MNQNKLMNGTLAWIVTGIITLSICSWLAWDFSADQTEERMHGEQRTQQHIEYAKDRIDKECLSLKLIALRDCIHKEIESARDHARAQQDLKAQQKMATFTKIMGYTAIVGLILGAISIGVIVSTLREMSRTNQIMRDEQRPWLTLEIEEYCDFFDAGHGGRIKPAFKFSNKGKMPAHNISMQVGFIKGDEDIPSRHDIIEFQNWSMTKDRRLDEAIIFGGETSSQMNPLSATNYRHWRKKPINADKRKYKSIVEGDTPSVIFCLVYDLDQTIHTKTGFEVRVFNLENASSVIDEERHKLEEWFQLRKNG